MVGKTRIVQCHLQTEVGVEVEDELGNYRDIVYEGDKRDKSVCGGRGNKKNLDGEGTGLDWTALPKL